MVVDRSKKGVVKRTITVTDVELIDHYLQFDHDKGKRKQQKGFANCRVVTKKGLTYYNIMIKIVATHTTRLATAERDYNKVQAEIEGTIGTLTAMGSTQYPESFEMSANNLRLLERYMRAFPGRMAKEGFKVDGNLLGICKAIHKQQKRSNSG